MDTSALVVAFGIILDVPEYMRPGYCVYTAQTFKNSDYRSRAQCVDNGEWV